jgi:hypothetical protein
MRAIGLWAVPVLVLNVGFVYAGDANPPILQAKLFRIVATAPLPPEAERLATVYGQEMEEGFEAFYFVQGSHLVDIDENSLSIESIRTSAGANIAEKRNDSDVPQIRLHWAATDGKCCIFSVKVGGHSQSKGVDELSIKGSVTALLASKRETQKIELKVNARNEVKVGPFTVEVRRTKNGTYHDPFSNDPFPGGVEVTVIGQTAGIIDIEFKDGDRKLPTNVRAEVHPLHSSLNGNSHDRDLKRWEYRFKRPNRDKVTMIMRYWSDLKEAKVGLGP